MPKHAGLCPDPYRWQRIGWTTLLKGGEHEALMAKAGYSPARDTPLARVLPWRILEFPRR